MAPESQMAPWSRVALNAAGSSPASTHSPCSPLKQPTPSFLRKFFLVLSPQPSPGNFLFYPLRPWGNGLQLPGVAPHCPQMEREFSRALSSAGTWICALVLQLGCEQSTRCGTVLTLV